MASIIAPISSCCFEEVQPNKINEQATNKDKILCVKDWSKHDLVTHESIEHGYGARRPAMEHAIWKLIYDNAVKEGKLESEQIPS